ncbi:MAG: response regulator [Candidatus Scalindua sp.]|nr:response regulator [Candidatus Scalindua sp.]
MILPKPTKQITAKNLRVLVVDDEEDIFKVLNIYFPNEGHNVKGVVNGTEAIKLLKSEIFDFVFCDLIMSEVGGRDVIK